MSITAPNGEYAPAFQTIGLRLAILANSTGPSINFARPIEWVGTNVHPVEYEAYVSLFNDGTEGVTITEYKITGANADRFTIPVRSSDYKDLVEGVEEELRIIAQSDGSGHQLSADLTVTARTRDGKIVTAQTQLIMGPTFMSGSMTVEPNLLHLGVNDLAIGQASATFTVRNLTAQTLTIRSVAPRRGSKSQFEVLDQYNGPWEVGPRAAVPFVVRFTPNGQGAPIDQVVLTCEQSDGRYKSLYVDLVTSPDTMAVRPAYVSMQTSPAKFRDTARVSLTLADGLDELITKAEFTLRFRNSDLQSVTAPVTTQSEGGFTMGTFAFDVTKHSAQTVLGELDFVVLSGAGTKVPIDVVSVQWFDINNTPLDAQTIVNGAVVSVLSEESSTFTVAPLPLTDVTTVTYPEMLASGTLEMMNMSGGVVHRADIATGTTSTAINTSSLPSGVYTVVLHTPNGILRKLVVR